jgi:cell division protein FtsZ
MQLHVVQAAAAPVATPSAAPAVATAQAPASNCNPDIFPEVARAPEAPAVASLTRTPSAPEPQPAAEDVTHPAYIQGRSFIAPRPAVPQQRGSANAEAEPLASARATQAREPVAKPKAPTPSLFQRIIGTGRQPQPAPQRTQPSMNTPRPQPQPQPMARQGEGEAAGHEEDYLDIPAFLRRQAN